MERRQFIDEVIAEPTSTFEKATKLRKVGVCFDTALRSLGALTIAVVLLGHALGLNEEDE